MAKQLNVDLTFGADVSKAKAQIAELEKALQSVAKLPGKSTSLFDDKSIKDASQAALELQEHLQRAVNVNTGKLDLSRLSLSIKSAGKDLGDYYSKLIQIGPQGQEAFLQVARAVASAEAPMTRVNSKLAEMGTALKNTARWQISSSILHGFMGSIQSAYRYAQDLNESLNEIRIVTGKSADSMDDFAVRANKAAKALSTSTTAYTDAALIFYQQGLKDDEVEARTNATIKMANVTGENASQVSSYMTAIWNNFEDGSKSLEYYGDVMALLGAQTAASSEEIASGLEKFAAIGRTVGLEYETAAAAVATVVDKTRESADTVGTAFKTIFARLQGLKLGETLEDGVDLNKYSSALEAVGVQVLDMNGDLRDADDILMDLGERWQTLTRAEQTALAQTVAGTRQYTHLMSLMSNFGDFKDNLTSAKGSEGTLTTQAMIYAESWEAAQERVSAAAEKLYDSLISDEFFIDVLGVIEKILDTVGEVVDGFGGLGGVLTTVGSVFMTYYAQKMPDALRGLKENLMVLTGQGGKLMTKMQDETKAFLAASTGTGMSASYNTEAEGLAQVITMRQKLMQNSKHMTSEEINQYEMRIKNVQAIYDEVKALAKKSEELDKQAKKSSSDFAKNTSSGISKTFKAHSDATGRVDKAKQKMDAALESTDINSGEQAEAWSREMAKAGIEADKLEEKIDDIKEKFSSLSEEGGLFSSQESLQKLGGMSEADAKDLQGFDMNSIIDNQAADGSLAAEDQKKLEKAIQAVTNAYKAQVTQRKKLDALSSGIKGQAADWKKNADAIGKSKKATTELQSNMKNYLSVIKKLAKENGVEIQSKDCEKLEKVLGKTEVSAQELVDAFEEFSKGADMGAIEKEIGGLDVKLEQLEGTLESVGTDNAGMKQMRDDAEAAAEATVNLATAQENAKAQADANVNSQFKMSVAITQAGAAAMSAYSMVQSLSSAITTFGDDNATTLEKVGAGLAVLMSAGQAWNAVMQLSTSLYKSEKVAKLASAAITKIFTGVKTTETGVVIANTAAWYANPIMWIAVIIMAVIAAIVALIAVISAQNKALEAANKEMLANAKANQEAIDSTQELANEVRDLTDAYDDLKASGESVTDVLKDMDEKVPALIQSYRDLAKSLGGVAGTDLSKKIDELETLYNYGRLTGDLSDFQAKQEEIDNEITKQEYENAKTGGRAGGKLMATKMNDATGGSMTNTKMTLDVGGSDNVWGDGKNADGTFKADAEEAIAKDILKNNMGSYFKDGGNAGMFSKTGAQLTVDYTDPAKFADYYEKLQQAQSEMLSTMTESQLADSDIYREISDALSAGAEYYEEIKPLADAQIEAGGKLAEAALLQKNADYASIDSLKEYTQYREDYIALAQKEYGLTKEQAEAYVDQNSKLSALNGEYKLANTMLDKFFNTDLDSLGKNKDEIMGYFDELTNGLSEEDMQIALGVVMNSESIEEFEQQMRHVTAQATTRAYEQMSIGLQEMMKAARDEGGFSQSDMNALGDNEDFTQFLGEQGMDGGMADFQNMNFDEQYSLIAEFYGKVQELRHESVEDQTELYYADLAALQTQHDAMLGLEREYAEAKQAVDEGIASEEQQATIEKYDQMTKAKEDYLAKQKELSKEGITEEQKAAIEEELRGMRNDFKDSFGFDIDLNTTDARSKMDDLLDQVKALNEQQIKIAIEWDGIEEIEGAFENVGDFASMMQKDAKKVGNSYQLTAAQAREWAEVYPDLFAQAKVSTNGIIELDQATVDSYLEGQNAEVDATVDAKIAELEAEKASMQAKLELVNADLEACYNNLKGKEQLENVSAEYLAEQRKNLTQYYMDLGMDEVNADKAALETMGLNEEEYTELVADAATVNANNQIDAAEAGGKAQTSALSKLAEKWKKFTSVLKQVGAAVKAALTGGDVKEAWNSVGDDFSTDAAEFQGKDLSGHSFEDLDESQITAARESVNSGLAATFEANKAEIEKAINSIDSQILYLKALKEQDISDFGSTDVDDVKDGKGDGKGDKGKDKTVEDLMDIADNYHYITRQIEMMNRQLDETSKKKDRAFGKDKLKLMKEEQAQLEALYEKQSDLFLLQTARKEAAAIKINENFNTDAVLDADGNISNYKALENEAINAFNKAKNDWNTSDQGDDAKKAFEEAEKQYEKQMELLEAYEETLDEWHDQKEGLQELANQIYDAKLEELDYKVQMQIEVADDDLAYLEYLLERIENKAFSAAEAIANLGQQTQKYFDKHAAYEQGIKDIFGNHGLTDEDYDKWLAGDAATMEKIGSMSFTEDEVSKLREYRDGLMETNRALIETRQAVHDKMLTTFDEHNAKLDEGIAKLEHYKAMTQSYKNIVDLVGKNNFKDSDKAIKAINESTVQQSKNLAEANIAKRDMIKADLEATQAAFEQQKDKISEEERKMWEDTIKQMETSLMEAEETAMSSIEEWMQAVNDQFVAEIEATMDRFSDTVAGKFKSLNELQDAFNRKQSENERYLEDYEKIYEFSKLNRDIEKSIDQTDNVRAKKELLKLQEEINALEESGAEVSEYQMENLRKRYELKLAEQALEEAKDAKSQVRMSRDSEGNWGYVYTADQSSVESAEQAYEDKLYELQEQNAEYINTLQENIINMQMEMRDKMAEIANDESLSIEQRQAKMAEVQAYYQEQMGYYTSELELALGNNKKLYDEDWTKYAERTGYKIAEDEKYVDSFAETDLAILTGFDNMADYQANFNTASEDMLKASNDAFDVWEANMDLALDAAGLDFQNLSEDIQDDLADINDKSDETAAEIKSDAETMVDDYQTVVDAIVDWEDQFSATIDNMLRESDMVIEKFNEVLDMWAEVNAAASQPLPTPPTTAGGGDGDGGDAGGGDGGGGGSGGGGGGNGGQPDWDRVVAAYNKINQGKWGNGIQNRISRGAADGFSEAEVRAGQQLINYTYPTHLNGMGKSREEAKKLMGYDTGGYTGSWGDQAGRLALLHQKELVLNQKDTENMLSAIDMVRQISNMIDLNAMSASQGLTSLLGFGKIGGGHETIEQNVTIHAEFPAVSDRNEIEEAFNNLINAASQYAHRKP